MAPETMYWNTEKVLQKEGKRASEIDEDLKSPYDLAMKNDWKRMKEYYEANPQKLNCPLTLDNDTALHIAASCCSKSSLDKHVLKFLINLLPSPDDKCRALRHRNKHGNNVLHEVAVSGNLAAAMFLVNNFNKPPPAEEITTTCSSDDTLPLLEIRNKLGESPIYRAAALGHTDLVQFFADKLKEENPDNLLRHFHRNDKMSILHIAVIGQRFGTAYWLQKNYKFLAQRKGGKGLKTSLQLLARMATALDPAFQQSKWKMLIYHCLPVGDLVTPNHKDNDVVKDDVESSLGSKSDQPPKSICRKTLAVILNVYTSMWNFLAKGQENGIIYKIWKDKKNKNYLKELIPLLVEEDDSWQDSTPIEDKTISLWPEENHDQEPTKPVAQILFLVEKLNNSLVKLIPLLVEKLNNSLVKLIPLLAEKTKQAKGETTVVPVEHGGDKKGKDSAGPTKSKKQKVYRYTPLLIATITGFVPIVEEILKKHPQAAEHVSDDGQNILHLTIKHRQRKILELLKRYPTTVLRLNARIDEDGNTILHQAADRSYYSIATAQKLIGPAMQLQDELRWMLRVQDIVPPHYTMHRNKKGQTAEELFNEEHNELLKLAQEWIKDTAQACSTVAVLVAGVVFAAAYAIPGDRGPNDSPLFWIFTCMDLTAISCALSSVAFFLSILSSPLEYPFFCHGLPRKLMTGFILLFLSMATTMLAFAASIFLLIRVEKKWTKSLLYSVALFPVPLFGLMQFPMSQFVNVIFRKISERFVVTYRWISWLFQDEINMW